MIKNVLTSGGWVKQIELSQVNTEGHKVRVYHKPEQKLEVAIEAIKKVHSEKKREVCDLKNLEQEIQAKIYLIREGQVIRLLDSLSEINLPFFSKIQTLISSSTNSSLPLFFKKWFRDLKQVYALIQSSKLSIEQQQRLFFYLAHQYHYNAPFSQKENERLEYQTSPLALAERNSYLRSSQTIWMQLATKLVHQQLNTQEKDISIVWIDHPNFVSFLSQFYQVIEVSFGEKESLPDLLKGWLDSYKEPLRPLYVFLKDIPGNPKERLNIAKGFAEKTLKEITDKLKEIENAQRLDHYFNQAPFPEALRKAALLILATKGGIGKKTDEYYTPEVLEFLKMRYGQELLKEHQKSCQKMKTSFAYENYSDDQLKFLLKLYKTYPKSFPSTPEFKKPKDIEEFLKDKNTSQAFKKNVLTLISAPDFLKSEDYFTAFQNDVLKNVIKSQHNAKDVVGIFYAASFEGLEALISPHGGKGMHNLMSVLGNVGYSPDAVRFLRTLLRGYPSFFPVVKQNSFLEAVIKTKYACLPKEAKESAASALVNLNVLTPSSLLKRANVYSDFCAALKNLSSLDNSSNWAHLYKGFLDKLLTPISQRKKDLNESTLFALWKMTAGLKNVLRDKDNIRLFVRDIQNVLEAWMLYIDINPLVQDPVRVFQTALPSQPTVVHFTPYAMRSFTRVLQAIAAAYPSNKTDRIQIQVFNQSYFELITNMERFRQTANIMISQSDAQIEDCDVYFIDIHPNNAVESRLFSHDIPQILQTLKKFPNNRPRTLVVDITLSSLSSSEIRNLLNEAEPLILSGQLNVVLVQSLTKFSQLGLDKLSAGCLAAYNNTNQQIWKGFNDQLHILQNQEPVDPLTLQFFACLAHYVPNFQKEYIEQINQNTKELYHMVLKRYQTLNLPISKHILALTCNTDLHTCYLALNSKGILSFDASFKLSLKEITGFTKAIIEELFIPLAEWLDLPLTERMSIGFPLSSINECMHVVRLTVGLEKELLPKYADLITYICFVMNRERDPLLFFERSQDLPTKIYPAREQYFKEKVNIFKTMYPVDGKISPAVRIKEPLENWTDAYREFVLDRGTIEVSYYTKQSRYGGPIQEWEQVLKEKDLYVHFAPNCDIPLTYEEVTPFIKGLLASCLTQRQTKLWNGRAKNEHAINLTSFNQPRNGLNAVEYLSFDAFFYTRIDNSTWNRFGYYYFPSNKGSTDELSFDFKDQKLWLVLNGKWFDENAIFIQKGHEILPATWLDMEEKWQLFEQASYTQLRELSMDGHRYEPDPNDPTEIELGFFDNKNPFVMIKRDKLAFKIDGLSLYFRKETKEKVQLEIDFWGIKNPIHVRFLNALLCYVALYKEKIPFDFVSESYGRVTLFEKNYSAEKFKKAAKEILEQREKILFHFDKKHQLPHDASVRTNPHGALSRFSIFNSVIPLPNFMENLFSSLKKSSSGI